MEVAKSEKVSWNQKHAAALWLFTCCFGSKEEEEEEEE